VDGPLVKPMPPSCGQTQHSVGMLRFDEFACAARIGEGTLIVRNP
jgi:hypothetical protein